MIFAGRTAVAAILAIALWARPSAAAAQAPGLGETGMNAAMVKLFGGNTSFTARAEFHVLDAHQKEIDFMPVTYAMLDGNLRMDVDMNQVKSADVPAAALAALKQMGMDQTVVITRPDKKVTYSIYPRAKAYAEIAMNKEETAALGAYFKMEKAPLGKETVDGHACQKDKVTFTGDKGQKLEATVWSAGDLKDFPVQMQMAADPNANMLIKFRDVKLLRPEAKQFEPPAGLTKYDSAEALKDALTRVPLPATPAK
jgi:hypothetical protein